MTSCESHAIDRNATVASTNCGNGASKTIRNADAMRYFHGHDTDDQLIALAASESPGPNLKGACSELGQRGMDTPKPPPGNKWLIKRVPQVDHK
jgi:hypothetical protein